MVQTAQAASTPSHEDFASMLEESFHHGNMQEGSVIKGTVVAIEKDLAVIDVGLKTTVDNKADVLLITDGDADRCGVGDENGEFINQLRVYALLAYYLLEVRGERGDIVKTLSTTGMLNKLGELYGVPVHETGVGFKYVAPAMIQYDALMGGEESGGYAFRNHVPERDGILT